MHPLDGAYVRLDRAMEHLAELKALNATFLNAEAKRMRKSARLDTSANPDVELYFDPPTGDIPTRFSVLIGEIASDLRASLDYLVFELAILDTGSEQKQTQFPVEDAPEKFRGNCQRFLKGINKAHTAAIERLQPYNGADWTKQLVAISNPHKHRHLIISNQGVTIATTIDEDTANFPKPGTGEFASILSFSSDDGPMHMYFHVTLFTAFEDDLPVIDTLEKIALQVADVLAYFKGEFHGV